MTSTLDEKFRLRFMTVMLPRFVVTVRVARVGIQCREETGTSTGVHFSRTLLEQVLSILRVNPTIGIRITKKEVGPTNRYRVTFPSSNGFLYSRITLQVSKYTTRSLILVPTDIPTL